MTTLLKTMSRDINSTFLTVAEVASILKLSALTVYKYIREQRLEAVEFGGHYRIDKSSFEKFITRQRVKKQIPRKERV